MFRDIIKKKDMSSIFVIDDDENGKNIEAELTETSNETVKNYNSTIKYMKKHGIKISTITLDCKLKVDIKLDKFAEHIILDHDGIVSIKYGGRKDAKTNRSIVVFKGNKNGKQTAFFNQATIRMKSLINKDNGYMNIKVFNNGSLHITGCKNMEDFFDVTKRLIKILKTGIDIENDKGEKKHIKFVKNEKECISCHDLNIRMINSDYNAGYKIDRNTLSKILNEDYPDVKFKYDPSGGHACVNIRYQSDTKKKPTSVFVFQTGSVIITGAKKMNDIVGAHTFIQNILDKNKNYISIPIYDSENINNILEEYKKSNRIKGSLFDQYKFTKQK